MASRKAGTVQGFAVRTHDSAAAFLAAASESGGCVLTDVRMPEIDGLELQQRLNDRGITLPVIVMTGQGDVPVAVRAMKAGAVDFLENLLATHSFSTQCAGRWSRASDISRSKPPPLPPLPGLPR
jgi:FixJ family two-component response regulator